MASPRIAVLGAGANGASIGADLTNAGLEVTLIEQWPDHVQAMRTNGLLVKMPDASVRTNVRVLNFCDVATLTEPFDVVLMLMKAYDSRWAAQLIEPHVAADGLVVGVQNGMTLDTVAEVVGAHRTLGCVIEVSSTMYEPGIVERHSGPDRSWFAIGSVDPTAEGRHQQIADLLRHAGTVEITDDIRSAKWMKLVSNATTLVTTAALGLPMLEAVEHPGMREFMIRSGQEAFDAAVASGHTIRPIFGLTEAEVAHPESLVETLLNTLLAGFVLSHTTTTILQDWNKGRHSEVDDINGHVVETSRRLGLNAPVNAAVVEVAHRIETHSLKPNPGNFDLLEELIASYPSTLEKRHDER
jgi:2-dehydropantoate 2-reductase